MSYLTEEHPAADWFRRITGFILLLVLAAVFLFSAWTKLIDFGTFELAFRRLGFTYTFSGIISRVFIGLEAMAGLLLLAHAYLRSFTYPFIMALLLMFTFYLLVLVSLPGGDEQSCGCFGGTLPMKPSAGIIKNLILGGMTALLYVWYPGKAYKQAPWLAGIIGMLSLTAPFLIQSRPINLDPLYRTSVRPHTELRRGKHIIAFMSLTCSHCRDAARSLRQIYAERPQLPVYIILTGPEAEQEVFFSETGAGAIPHFYFSDGKAFSEMAGPFVPVIYFVHNGMIDRQLDHPELDGAVMERWAR